MSHCPSCAVDVIPVIDALPGGVVSAERGASPLAARFVQKCPNCEQVLGPAAGQSNAIAAPAYTTDHLSNVSRTFSARVFKSADEVVGQAPMIGDVAPVTAPPKAQANGYTVAKPPPLDASTGEDLLARTRARLAALEQIVPGLTEERNMLRRMVRASERRARKAGAKEPTNVIDLPTAAERR